LVLLPLVLLLPQPTTETMLRARTSATMIRFI
jgi:hypothetical protein